MSLVLSDDREQPTLCQFQVVQRPIGKKELHTIEGQKGGQYVPSIVSREEGGRRWVRAGTRGPDNTEPFKPCPRVCSLF